MPACAIVIDVLRATTTMATALQSGAEAIQVFDDLDELFRTQQEMAGRKTVAGRRAQRRKAGRTSIWAIRRRNARPRKSAASGSS
jgi:2-phosphosulfolactate phosphatase